MSNLIIEGKTYSYDHPIKLLDVALKKYPNALAARVNGRVRELDFYVYSDAFIEFLDNKNQEAIKIYEATLHYIILKALNDIFPNIKVVVSNYISRSSKFHLRNYRVKEGDLEKLLAKVEEIVNNAYPIIKKRVTKEELIEHYHDQNYYEKIRLIQDKSQETFKAYVCDDYYNYMYSMMLPNTSYVKEYIIKDYENGFIVQAPRFETNGRLPEWHEIEAYKDVINNQSKWLKMLGIRNLVDMNDLVSTKQGMIDFVNICETKHNNHIAEIGNIIDSKRETIKLIAIAGPSSSGKTTFCNRLRIELMTKGIKPVMISIDDYYLDRDKCVLDENGEKDFEHIESLDLELFNDHLKKLINGEEVELQSFDFNTGLSKPSGKIVKLEKGSVILIEGIHALNERLTSSIDRSNKFKIFISPVSMYNFDNHNPFNATDVRLLRRIVRDKLFRNSSPELTLSMWASVRKGEFNWIYPFQNDADYSFNTELTYEVMVMRKYALPSLLTVKKSSQYYYGVKKLVALLTNVVDIDDKLVPCNSLLREFIGGSCFYD